MNDTIMIIIYVLGALSLPVLVYCYWFALKYDKDLNQLMLLFVFNALYLPFYFSRMKRIKKEMRINAEKKRNAS
jgi:Na+/glutamate symporter